ncbi:MAG: sigma-70 family RNA polymerase sigma factor [Peptoniphilaceae bacterium]|nr:sigma-70 family RNA polymerase sigma factor [Peptoniphilaceae bacterium]MDY6019713.1 sigma-70 family RNA polymerase sigma factor [Anaerococcus sp.]
MIDIEKIYSLYFEDLYKFILYLSNNKEIAEDVTSETFLKVMANMDKIKNEASIKTYLLQIGKNTYYTYIKRNRKILLLEDYEENIKNKENIEEDFIKNEEKSSLERLIEKLDQPYKDIVKLRIYQEMSFKEIGLIFNKTANWACVCFYRAKENLKEGMKSYEQ